MSPSHPLLRGKSITAVLVCLCLGFSFPFAKVLALILTLALWASTRLQQRGQAPASWLADIGDQILLTGILVSLAELRFALAYPHTALAPAFLVIPIFLREFQVYRLHVRAAAAGAAAPESFLDPWYRLVLYSALGFTLFAVALVEDFLPGIDSHLLKSIEYTLHWCIWFAVLCAAVMAVLSLVDHAKSPPGAES